MPYMIRPETHDRINHRFSMDKGIDLVLDPSEIQASIRGGDLFGDLKKGAAVLHFIGNEIIQPIATFIAPVAKPIIQAGTRAAVSTIDRTYNPGKYYTDQAERVSGIIHPYMDQPSAPSSIQHKKKHHYSTSNIAIAGVQAALANSFTPFAEPVTPYESQVGVVDTAYSRPTLASHVGYGIHPGHLQAKGMPFHATHPARFSTYNDVGFMQQIPQVFKDSARIASGRGLYL